MSPECGPPSKRTPSSRNARPIASEFRSHKNDAKGQWWLVAIPFDKSIVTTSHMEDWNFGNARYRCWEGSGVGRGCDCSKSLSTFNKQVVSKSPPLECPVENTRSASTMPRATKSSSMTSKKEGHGLSWHVHRIASPNGVLWGRPVLLGLEDLGGKPQSQLASVDGRELVGLHLGKFHHGRARQKQVALQALFQHREMN